MSTTITILIIYLAILMGLAIWSRRESNTLSGYYLAGKKLPFWVVAFSTNATGESGWLLLGLSGVGYAIGFKAYWIVIGEVLGLVAAWWIIARRIKKLSDKNETITIPDILANNFPDKANLIRGVAVLIIVLMSITYVTAQMIATGKAFNSFLGLDYVTGVTLGSIFIIGYTFIGGYKAASYTDVMQGFLMLLGLIIVPAAAIYASGGWEEILTNLATQDPTLINLFAVSANGGQAIIIIASFLAIGLPLLGMPQLLVRFISARDDGEIKKARIVSSLVLLVLTFGAVTVGVAGRALFPGLEDPENIFPVISNNLFPQIISGMLLVVVLSAIMSTVDSLLLLVSSSIIRDTYQKILKSSKDEKTLANYGKYVTIFIGLIAVLAAVQEPRVIFDFVLLSWSGLGSAFGPVIIGILYNKKITWKGVFAGMSGGFLASTIWVAWFKADYYGLYEAIPGFIVGLILTFGVSWLTSQKK
ncbi:MAG: hypothetical protein CMQ54_03265 [Gammaproteobacteria bacterium]|nr:hypothetical protein [Gammaproteobacteria bacterium]